MVQLPRMVDDRHSGSASARNYGGSRIFNRGDDMSMRERNDMSSPVNCGTSFCSCIECVALSQAREYIEKCKTHPDSPHGFLRNASHNEGRYVCECEHWEEPK